MPSAVALGDAVIALVANKAAREGLRIDFKPEWFDPEKPPDTPEGDQTRPRQIQSF